ncbi:MarR family winged helix-turn-helix transcriptional regulator [Jeongeupia naejangsanensis]|uniref:MarR family transcriptional regulator n=1 Tax=Jeongeupia naejangsanensis TaxID=613195 RepID=A0ABS2BKW7_9NEIS|nr:MarR family transcriptional regulator [Jeongeupia naejangsanensis]MBM3115626.1 MarR family transcriptional regulator [Jeongeupia naejangsanensis]
MEFEARIEHICAANADAPRDAIIASRRLFRAAHLLERRINAALAPHGLEMREYIVLTLLAHNAEAPMRPTELSVTLDATRTQITRLLDALEKRSLLGRMPSATDRRGFELEITDQGRALQQQAVPSVYAAYEACWALVAPELRPALISALGSIDQGLSQA